MKNLLIVPTIVSLLMLGAGTARGETSYSVLYVRDYASPLWADLNTVDATWVDSYLSTFNYPEPWYRDQYEGDGQSSLVETHDFNTSGTSSQRNAKRSDYVYFAGHGHAYTVDAALILRNGDVDGADPKTTAFWFKDMSSPERHGLATSSNVSYWEGDDTVDTRDVEWGHFAACSVLARNGWKYGFNRGLNLILGYREPAPDGNAMMYITQDFLWRVTGVTSVPAETLWSGYINANRWHGETGWAIDGYLNHRYDWWHGFSAPPGYTNYTPYEYYDDTQIYQWNEQNYPGPPWQLGKAELKNEEPSVLSRIWLAFRRFFGATDSALAQEVGSLADGKLKVAADLPNERPEVSGVTVEPEILDRENLAGSLLSGQPQRIDKDQKTIYTDGRASVAFYPSGAVLYSSENLDTVKTSLDVVGARERAEGFIAQNGGLPAGFALSRVSTINQTNLTTGESDVIAWALTYRPKVDGMEVIGPGGSQIDAVVSDRGVFSYMRYVLKPTVRGDRATGLSADQAVAAAAEAIAQNLGHHAPATVTTVNLAYLSPAFDRPQNDLRPIWRLETDIGEDVYLDAVTGSVVSGKVR